MIMTLKDSEASDSGEDGEVADVVQELAEEEDGEILDEEDSEWRSETNHQW